MRPLSHGQAFGVSLPGVAAGRALTQRDTFAKWLANVLECSLWLFSEFFPPGKQAGSVRLSFLGQSLSSANEEVSQLY